MGSRYNHNYRAFGEHALRGAFMRAEMARRAEAVEARAKATARVGDGSDGETPGEYRDGFQSETRLRPDHHGGRWVGRVFNDVRYAAVLEFGRREGDDIGDRTLTRALDAGK